MGAMPIPGTVGASPGGTGATDASTLNPACLGMIPSSPQHTVNVTGPIPNLRIMVRSNADTTLVDR